MPEEIRVREAIVQSTVVWTVTGNDEVQRRRGRQWNAFNLSTFHIYFQSWEWFKRHLAEAVRSEFPCGTATKRRLAAAYSHKWTRSHFWRLDAFVPEFDAAIAHQPIREQPP
jgi:hypothetical protein